MFDGLCNLLDNLPPCQVIVLGIISLFYRSLLLSRGTTLNMVCTLYMGFVITCGMLNFVHRLKHEVNYEHFSPNLMQTH